MINWSFVGLLQLKTFKTSRGQTEVEIASLQEELDEARTWKSKVRATSVLIMSCAHVSSYLASQYENVRKQARSMKESYEERVRTLEAEVAQLTETNDRSLAKAREVATALQRQVREARQEGEAKVQQVREEQDGDSKQELDAEVSIGLRYDVTEEGRIHEIPVHCCR